MKLVATVAVIVATVLIACTSEPAPSPAQTANTSAPRAESTAVTATVGAPVEQTTNAAVALTPTEPTEAPTSTAPAAPTIQPTALPTNVPQMATASPAPAPTATHASETKLLKVAVAEIPDGLPDYDRHDWKHWVDADGDCQDARNEVLVAESRTAVSFKSERRCRVAAGEWLAPYTSATVTDPSKLDIDHMVPLRNAHLSGAWRWPAQQREQYANYLDNPQHLIAVTASANRSKGARGPEDWKPEDRSYWCQYAIDWVTIKDSWELMATAAEFTALEEMLSTCDVPHLLGVAVSLEKPDLPTFGGRTPVPTPTPDGGSPAARYDSCVAAQAAGETRVRGSQGGGRGFPKSMVPGARDGDGDGVVCER